MFLSHAALKDLRALKLKKHRMAQGRFVVEGSRLVTEAVRAGRATQLFATKQFLDGPHWTPLEPLIQEPTVPVEQLTATQAEQLADTRQPQGVFAVVRLPEVLKAPAELPPLPVVILDEISDPGNLGTLLRTADWFGIPAVLVSATSADIYNPKVVRGGMGAHFHIPHLVQTDLAGYAENLRRERVPIIGATLDGKPLESLAEVSTAWALVLGSEVHGLSPFWRERLTKAITIPGQGQAESLNVAVAGGILLYHLPGRD
ncbi:23S rRNA (adenosine(1067)-2'-O)-methyltransferase [subsurface metagenome]